MDERKCGILILLDLSAAFDTVVNCLLLKDLKAIGIDSEALNYLKTFLINRTYCVQVSKAFSRTKVLARGSHRVALWVLSYFAFIPLN